MHNLVEFSIRKAQATVSFWQNNLTGIKVSRYANWIARRPCVSYIEGVAV